MATWRNAAATVIALLSLYILLILPNNPGAMTPGALRIFPLEFPAIVALLAALRGTAAKLARALITLLLTLMLLLKLADFATSIAYLRLFNPVLDLHLVPAAWRLLSGAAGAVKALVATAAAVLAIFLIAAVVWWATGQIARLALPRTAAVLVLPAMALVWLDAARPSGIDPPGTAFTTRLAGAHVRFAMQARTDLARFRCEASGDPYAAAEPADLLTRLRGRDVLVIVIESYGRAALDNPLYADTTREVLTAAEPRLAALGMTQRSAFLTSPVIGGQSWLAHASLLSGLWVDNQSRYRALLLSQRQTLMHLARRAGWTTAAVMPAITLDWPEAAYFGYDVVLDAAGLGYMGPAFNWVTMPDQFTLSAFENRMLDQDRAPPVFAEIALISSHAPWTPIPELVPWEAVGDGRIFERFANRGDPPDVLWRDRDRVRDQYRQALGYTLGVATAFAERRAGTAPLILVLGDHQPAPFVAGGDENRDVPVHLIGPPDILAAIDAWDWATGMIPSDSTPVWPMDAFRDRFLAAFSGAVGTASRNPQDPAPFTDDTVMLGSCD